MTGKEKTIRNNKFVLSKPDTSSQEATDEILGTDSVTDVIHEQVIHEQEMRAREEQARRRETARREIEDYINHHLANSA